MKTEITNFIDKATASTHSNTSLKSMIDLARSKEFKALRALDDTYINFYLDNWLRKDKMVGQEDFDFFEYVDYYENFDNYTMEEATQSLLDDLNYAMKIDMAYEYDLDPDELPMLLQRAQGEHQGAWYSLNNSKFKPSKETKEFFRHATAAFDLFESAVSEAESRRKFHLMLSENE